MLYTTSVRIFFIVGMYFCIETLKKINLHEIKLEIAFFRIVVLLVVQEIKNTGGGLISSFRGV